MESVEKIAEIKARVEDELLQRPGVTGVDVGYKYVGGKKTDEIAIRVHVEKKKKTVPEKERIPEEIEGVKTDVLERTYELHPASMPVDQIELMVDTGTYSPVKGGISIGPCRAVGGYVFVGTLGAIVRDNVTHDPMLLSNFHVMCIDNGWHVGDTMAQPGRVDSGTCPADVVGTLQRASLGGHVDCAVSSLSGRGYECDIVDIGAVTGTAAATLGMHVRKRGRTTGLTYGTVDSIAATVTIDYGDGIGHVTLTNQIGIAVDTTHSTKIGDHGDSGSVVVNDSRHVIGLYFAGSTDGTSGLANPIADVLSALNVSLCVAPVKSFLKDFKHEKIEHKDFKIEKLEPKEHKLERFEKILIKDAKPEHEKIFKESKAEREKLFEVPVDPFQPGLPQPFQPAAPHAGEGEAVPQAGGNCDDFRTFTPPTGSNPLTTSRAKYTVHQFGGAVPPTYTISSWGGTTGLNCGFELEIEVVGDPCPTVSVTLVHFAQPATIEAFNDDGSLAGTKTMTAAQRTAQTFDFSGKIRRVVITPPSDETLLLEFCCGAKPGLIEKPDKEPFKEHKIEPKEHKPEKFEPKEHKPEKFEPKEHKPEKFEPKEHKPEKFEKEKHEKEKREKNEFKEHKPEKLEKDKHEKEQKFEPKEHKFEPKEHKLEPKEIKNEKFERPEKDLLQKEHKPEKGEIEGPGPLDPGELRPAAGAIPKPTDKLKQEPKEFKENKIEKLEPKEQAKEKLEKPEKEKHEKEKHEKEKREKNEFKEHKPEKLEKDKHEKEHKFEPKEHKFEPKENKFEPKEHKLEPKEIKVEPKEHKIEPKEHKLEPKEAKDEKFERPEKDLLQKEHKPEKGEVEGPGLFDPGELFPGGEAGFEGQFGSAGSGNPGWEHFIGSELRPDLSQGALRQEEDQAGGS